MHPKTISKKPSGTSPKSTIQIPPKAKNSSSKKSTKPIKCSQIKTLSRNTTKSVLPTTLRPIVKINRDINHQDLSRGITPQDRTTSSIHIATIAAINLSKAGITEHSENSSWMIYIVNSTTNRCGNNFSRHNENKCREPSDRWWDKLPEEIQTNISDSTISKWKPNKLKQGEDTNRKCEDNNRESINSTDAIEIKITQTQLKKLSSSWIRWLTKLRRMSRMPWK